MTYSEEERYIKKSAGCSDAELRRVTESRYDPEARKAAASLLGRWKGFA